MNKDLEQGLGSDGENSLDFLQLWNHFVKHWQWFVASVVACLLVACIYLWFVPAKVNVMGKMQVMDESKQGGHLSIGMSMLNSLPMGLGSSLGSSLGAALGGGIETEEEILMSNNLSRDVVNELGLYTEYHLKSWGRKTLLYQNQPLNVTISPDDLKKLEDKLPLKLVQIKLIITKSGDNYTVEPIVKENKEKTELPEQTFMKLPATIDTGVGTLMLSENTQLEAEDRENYQDGYTIQVTILPPSERAADFVERLIVEQPLSKAPDIAAITLEDESVLRGVEFVNTLVELYNKRVNEEKNEEALKTDEFVRNRLANLDVELGHSDAAWEKSKKNFQITDPTIDAQEIMQNKSVYESKMVEVGTQIQIHDYLKEYVDNPANLYELIPVGLGGFLDMKDDNTPGLVSSKASLIEQHNALVSQRKELLKSMTEKAPPVERLTQSIKELHPVLQTAMKRDRQNLVMKRDALDREFSKYMGRVSSAPQMERVLTEIGRQREIKQGVYLLMLQQREETAMTLANISDKGKLIDAVRMVKDSKHPKKKIVLLAAILLGLLFPMPFLYFQLTMKH